MMKFLVFDSVGIAIFTAAPFLRESVASSLAVSLFSGAVAGVASAIVSQPGRVEKEGEGDVWDEMKVGAPYTKSSVWMTLG